MIESFDMTWKQKLTVLMILHVLWGLALWFSISKYGLGIATDSVHVLFGALNLSAGRGLFSFDGTFVLFWPPLYPALLALIHLVSGLDPFISAGILQTIAFLGMSICLAMIYLEIFPDSFWLAVAGSILSDIGVVVLTSFDVVGSDYVHLFFVVLYLLLTGYYIKSKSARLLLAMSAVGIAVALQRYLGIAALATGATMVFFFSDGELRRRTLHTALLALSALPAGIWLLVTSVLINRRMPVSFLENFKWFSLSILQ